MRDYTLQAFTNPVTQGKQALGDITAYTLGWRRSIRWNGGCWLGTFRMQAPIEDLRQVYAEWLGHHVEEHSPTRSWAGMIYSMDLAYRGDVKRRSLEDLVNAVKTTYINTADPPDVLETSWYTNSDSILRYGRKEEALGLDGYPQAAAEARAQTLLRECGWPWPRTVGLSMSGGAYLDVKLAGYAFTANWKYVTSADDAEGNVNAWISSIVSTDCPFLIAGRINTNTLQVKRSLNVRRRAWDKLIELAGLGEAGADPDPWRVHVDANRQTHYEAYDTAVKYYWTGGELLDTGRGRVNRWLVQPGVVRDENYPVRRTEPGNPLLADARDALIEEVEVGETGIYLKTAYYEETEILAAQQEYRKMLEDEAKREAQRLEAERREWERERKRREEDQQ